MQNNCMLAVRVPDHQQQTVDQGWAAVQPANFHAMCIGNSQVHVLLQLVNGRQELVKVRGAPLQASHQVSAYTYYQSAVHLCDCNQKCNKPNKPVFSMAFLYVFDLIRQDGVEQRPCDVVFDRTAYKCWLRVLMMHLLHAAHAHIHKSMFSYCKYLLHSTYRSGVIQTNVSKPSGPAKYNMALTVFHQFLNIKPAGCIAGAWQWQYSSA